MPAVRVGDYVVRRKLGQGSFGAVFLADGPDGAVALKQLAADQSVSDKEVDLLRAVQHPHIVRLLSSFRARVGLDLSLFIVMELCDGGSVADAVARGGPLVPAAAWRVAADVAGALSHLHGLRPQVMHRDLKPHNVLLRGGRARLADFGVARHAQREGPMSQTVAGTFAYMAPEVVAAVRSGVRRGVYGPASDVWSLGCVLHEMASGRPCFLSMDDTARGRRASPTPAWCGAAVDAALALRAERRPDAAVFAELAEQEWDACGGAAAEGEQLRVPHLGTEGDGSAPRADQPSESAAIGRSVVHRQPPTLPPGGWETLPSDGLFAGPSEVAEEGLYCSVLCAALAASRAAETARRRVQQAGPPAHRALRLAAAVAAGAGSDGSAGWLTRFAEYSAEQERLVRLLIRRRAVQRPVVYTFAALPEGSPVRLRGLFSSPAAGRRWGEPALRGEAPPLRAPAMLQFTLSAEGELSLSQQLQLHPAPLAQQGKSVRPPQRRVVTAPKAAPCAVVADRPQPEPVRELAGWDVLGLASSGGSAVYALTASAVWTWGAGDGALLGDGIAGPPRSVAVPQRILLAAPRAEFVQLAAGAHGGAALDSSGALWVWGAEGFGPSPAPQGERELPRQGSCSGLLAELSPPRRRGGGGCGAGESAALRPAVPPALRGETVVFVCSRELPDCAGGERRLSAVTADGRLLTCCPGGRWLPSDAGLSDAEVDALVGAAADTDWFAP